MIRILSVMFFARPLSFKVSQSGSEKKLKAENQRFLILSLVYLQKSDVSLCHAVRLWRRLVIESAPLSGCQTALRWLAAHHGRATLNAEPHVIIKLIQIGYLPTPDSLFRPVGLSS